MTPISELITMFEQAIEQNKEKESFHSMIPIDVAKTILSALRHEEALSEKTCTCDNRIQEKTVPHFCTEDLSATTEGMLSPDYKERFKAEYYQTKIRYERLKKFNTRIKAAEITGFMDNAVKMPKHDCPVDLLRDQQRVMGEYLRILEVRAVIEGIDL